MGGYYKEIKKKKKSEVKFVILLNWYLLSRCGFPKFVFIIH